MTQDALDLIVPVYLDIDALLGILASVEDGFVVLEKISTQTSTAKTTESKIGTEFGFPNIPNILKISIGAFTSKKHGEQIGEERYQERYHTYGSLFYKLRSHLIEGKILKQIIKGKTNLNQIEPFDFIELQGIFRPNPMIEFILTIEKLIAITDIFQKKNKIQAEQMKQIKEFFKSLRTDLEPGDIRTFMVEVSNAPEYKAIVPIFTEYLRDQTMTELSYKEFRLLGKVARKLSNNEHIDLLRGTGLGGIGEENLRQFLDAFKAQTVGLNIPKFEYKINGPALEIVPIAIYV